MNKIVLKLEKERKYFIINKLFKFLCGSEFL